jgi:hypothetical protein
MRALPSTVVVLFGVSGCMGSVETTAGAGGSMSSEGTGGRTANGGRTGDTGGSVVTPEGGAGGAVDGTGGAGSVVLPPSRPSAPLRRLSRLQYNNTVRDLLGDTSRPADGFLPDEVLGSFSGSAALARVAPVAVEQYRLAAERLAAKAATNLTSLVSCRPADTAGEEACVRTFLADFGLRAYRRPLSADEVAGKLELFRKVRVEGDFAFGIQAVVAALLQSPFFLYRAELPPAGALVGALVPLGPYEIASRLSYFLLNTMPDPALFAAAQANGLATPAAVEAQARRLLQDPRARAAANEFFGQWLILGALDDEAKDATLFPEFNDTLRAAMKEETLRFTTSTLFDGDARLETLLTSSRSIVNAPLGKLYGVTAAADYGPVDLDPSQRAGLLTQASILTRTAHSDGSSPTRRGKFVREALMCQPPPPPPPGVDTTPPPRTPNQTRRALYAQHATNPVCAACHQLTDPVGFGFENYDAIGRYQTMDGGKPIDASGEISASEDLDGVFVGAVALAKKLAASNSVRTCMAEHWFSFALGRAPAAGDEASIKAAFDGFAPGGDLRALMVALTRTDSFLTRVVEAP